MITYYLKDEVFEKIFLLLKENKTVYCNNVKKVRGFLEGIYYMMRTGCQWSALPRGYGLAKSVHKRYLAWVRKGIWDQLLSVMTQDKDTTSVMIDATVVRAHACAAGYEKASQEDQALGRSKGGFATKVHVCVDALGRALRFILTPGQSSEIKQAQNLIAGIKDRNILARYSL